MSNQDKPPFAETDWVVQLRQARRASGLPEDWRDWMYQWDDAYDQIVYWFENGCLVMDDDRGETVESCVPMRDFVRYVGDARLVPVGLPSDMEACK